LKEGKRTYNPRIDREFDIFFAALTLRMKRISEDGYTCSSSEPPSYTSLKTDLPQHSLHMSILRLKGVTTFNAVIITLKYPTICSLGFDLANSSTSASVYNALTLAFRNSSTSLSETGNGGFTCSLFVRRWASARRRRASAISGSISSLEFPLRESLAVFSMRQPGLEMSRILREGVKEEAESQREE
jgi:hypothetical protein